MSPGLEVAAELLPYLRWQAEDQVQYWAGEIGATPSARTDLADISTYRFGHQTLTNLRRALAAHDLLQQVGVGSLVVTTSNASAISWCANLAVQELGRDEDVRLPTSLGEATNLRERIELSEALLELGRAADGLGVASHDETAAGGAAHGGVGLMARFEVYTSEPITGRYVVTAADEESASAVVDGDVVDWDAVIEHDRQKGEITVTDVRCLATPGRGGDA